MAAAQKAAYYDGVENVPSVGPGTAAATSAAVIVSFAESCGDY